MKRLFKPMEMFIFILLGCLLITNVSMAAKIVNSSIPSKTVCEGESVSFNLRAMFGNKADPKTIWVIAPDGTKFTLSGTDMFVISNVSMSDSGYYSFFCQNREGQYEYRVALNVMPCEPYNNLVFSNSQFLEISIFSSILFPCILVKEYFV